MHETEQDFLEWQNDLIRQFMDAEVDSLRYITEMALALHKASLTSKGYPRADIPEEVHRALKMPRIRKVLRGQGIELDD